MGKRMYEGKNFSGPENQSSLLDLMPKEVRETFTDEQIQAIITVLQPGTHSVDIRLSIPFVGGRRYVVLLIGKERRSLERRKLERLRRPLRTPMNVATIALLGVCLIYFLIGLIHILFAK